MLKIAIRIREREKNFENAIIEPEIMKFGEYYRFLEIEWFIKISVKLSLKASPKNRKILRY